MIRRAWLTYAPLSLPLVSTLDFVKWASSYPVILAIISLGKVLMQAGRYARHFTVRDNKM